MGIILAGKAAKYPVVFRKTYILRFDEYEEKLEKITKELSEEHEWVNVSDSYPVILTWLGERVLKYIITVTAGTLE